MAAAGTFSCIIGELVWDKSGRCVIGGRVMFLVYEPCRQGVKRFQNRAREGVVQ